MPLRYAAVNDGKGGEISKKKVTNLFLIYL